MPVFSLTIDVRTGMFGDSDAAERQGVARLLRQAAQEIQSGAPATPLMDSGHRIGSYEFGPDMINGPGASYDRTNIHLKPANEGGRINRVPVIGALEQE